jgi:hypothetical protein
VNTDRKTAGLLGAAFLIVFIANMLSGALLTSAVRCKNLIRVESRE